MTLEEASKRGVLFSCYQILGKYYLPDTAETAPDVQYGQCPSWNTNVCGNSGRALCLPSTCIIAYASQDVQGFMPGHFLRVDILNVVII